MAWLVLRWECSFFDIGAARHASAGSRKRLEINREKCRFKFFQVEKGVVLTFVTKIQD